MPGALRLKGGPALLDEAIDRLLLGLAPGQRARGPEAPRVGLGQRCLFGFAQGPFKPRLALGLPGPGGLESLAQLIIAG